jgi:hypothetical protein
MAIELRNPDGPEPDVGPVEPDTMAEAAAVPV